MNLSSRQSAILLHTHESSVKRWCNAGELACTFTEGGHRRIRLADLLRFASEQDIPCELLRLGSEAESALKGIFALRRGKMSEDIVLMLKSWLLEADSRKVLALIIVSRSFDISLSVIFDRMIGDLMRHIGDSWAAGAFGIGEEHRVSESILDVLYHLQSDVEPSSSQKRPTAILGTGPGDEHVTGALMVRTLLTEAGWNVVFLGRRVPVEDLVLFQKKYQAPLVCISVAAERTQQDIADMVQSMRNLSGDDSFQIAIGGAGVQTLLSESASAICLDHVSLFDSATDFSVWASTTLNHHRKLSHEVN